MEDPAVAVLVAEGRLREVGATWRVQTRWPTDRHLADLDTAADEILPGRIDIGVQEQLNQVLSIVSIASVCRADSYQS